MRWFSIRPRRGHTIHGTLGGATYHYDDSDEEHDSRYPDSYRYDFAP